MRCPILKTIIYFNLFSWPLRAEEIWKWIYLPNCEPKINEIIYALKNKRHLQEALNEKNGFYFLKECTENILPNVNETPVEVRLKRYSFAEKKYKKILRFAKIASFFPFIKMVAICNDLGYSNAPNNSDIDLFIVSSKGKVWTARFLITGFLKIFGLRPGEKTKDAICPSFFVDEDNLNLEILTLKNQKKEIDDPHFIFWINQMTPILNKNETYEKFREKNSWVKKFLPNIYNYKCSDRRKIKISSSGVFENIFNNSIGNFLEKKLKEWQLKIMPSELKAQANINTNIVIQNGILKFHKNDTRESVRKKFYNKLRNYKNDETTKNN